MRRQNRVCFCNDLSDTVLLNPPKYNTLRHSLSLSPADCANRPHLLVAADLEKVFDRTFAEFDCVLRGGADEPLYTPGRSPREPARVSYTRDYFASALHEVAHWCIAGEARRRQLDYGYWYAPDGRTAAQQRAFEQVEVRPQALEWLFSLCCGHRFRISADNLEAGVGASDRFEAAVRAQARVYVRALASEADDAAAGPGLPPRGRLFALSLCAFYRRSPPSESDLEPLS